MFESTNLFSVFFVAARSVGAYCSATIKSRVTPQPQFCIMINTDSSDLQFRAEPARLEEPASSGLY